MEGRLSSPAPGLATGIEQPLNSFSRFESNSVLRDLANPFLYIRARKRLFDDEQTAATSIAKKTKTKKAKPVTSKEFLTDPDPDTAFTLIIPEIRQNPKYATSFYVHEELVDVLDFMRGREFKKFLCNILQVSAQLPTPARPYLETKLHNWQDTGVERLIIAAKGPFGGALLCDAVGLGKSLTTLIAALELRRTMRFNCDFVLITCPTNLVGQWVRELDHFHKDQRPKCLVLKHGDCSANELKRYDIVICTHEFLRSRYLEYREIVSYTAAVNAFGADVANQHLPRPKKKSSLPLHSAKTNIPVLIVDESHVARNENSLLNKAIKSLRYRHSFLLSGTAAFNSWTDYSGQIQLLPHSPFHDTSHFIRLFNGTERLKDFSGMLAIAANRSEIFFRFISSIVIARLKVLNGLLPVIEHMVEFEVGPKYYKQALIVKLLVEEARVKRQPKKDGPRTALPDSGAGFIDIVRARIYASCPIALTASDKSKTQHIIAWELCADRVRVKTQEFLASIGSPSNRSLEDLTREEFIRLEKTLLVAPPKRTKKRQRNQELTESGDQDTSQPIADVPQDTSVTSNQDVSAGDLDCVDVKSSGGALGDECTTLKDRLRSVADEEIHSPRIDHIIKTLTSIKKKEDNILSKVLITSEYVVVLDVIMEAISRSFASETVAVFEYNGRAENRDGKECTVEQFRKSSKPLNVLLLSALAGGAGLNLQMATHIIICEPLRSPGLAEQVIGRSHRLGQTEQVHVWHMFSNDYEIDKLLDGRQRQKNSVIDAISRIVCRDDRFPTSVGHSSLPTWDILNKTQSYPETLEGVFAKLDDQDSDEDLVRILEEHASLNWFLDQSGPPGDKSHAQDLYDRSMEY